MNDFNYSYKKLYRKSQCDLCKNEGCSDMGKLNSHYDGKRHSCSRFKEHTPEREAEMEHERRTQKQKDELEKYLEDMQHLADIYD